MLKVYIKINNHRIVSRKVSRNLNLAHGFDLAEVFDYKVGKFDSAVSLTLRTPQSNSALSLTPRSQT